MRATTLPLRNLGIHRLRSVLTAVGIAAALASLLALVGLSRGVDRSISMSLENHGTHLLALKKGAIEVLTATLDESLAGRLRAVPGVINVMAGLGDFVELSSGEMAYMAGWPAGSEFWRSMTITAGTLPPNEDSEGVVLGQALAELLGKHPGDSIELSGKTFRISAISKQASVIDDRSVMMPLKQLQLLLGRHGTVSGFHLRIDHPENATHLAEMKNKLNAQFPELSFIESNEMANNSHLTKVLRAMAWGSSAIALIMAFVTILNTLLMAVTERSKEIGLLSAIGWQPARVIAMIVLEGVITAAAGALLGVVLGLLGLQLMMKNPQVGGLFQPEVTTLLVLQSVAVAILVGALGSLYPAWRATRLRPMELLRGE